MEKGYQKLLFALGLIGIGFVLGLMVSGFMTRERVKTYQKYSRGVDVKQKVYDITNASNDQKELLAPIIDKYQGTRQKYYDKKRHWFKKHNDSMYQDMESVLDEKQLEELKDHHWFCGKKKIIIKK